MKRIAIIGAGTMGNGIAHIFAQYGFSVALVDTSGEALSQALHTIASNFDRMIRKGVLQESDKLAALARVETFTDLANGVVGADLAIEAATEQEEIKKRIFRSLDEFAPAECILATNTSSISITGLASVTNRPEQVIGMHFMNPVPVMELVEVIRGYATSDKVGAAIRALSVEIGKTPVEVQDYPGFVANRILMPMINEAISALHEGVADVEAIDTVMKLGMAHPMGPLQLADFIGLDVCLSILRVLHQGFGNPKYAPSPLLVNMVAAGRLGMKSGEGFYVHEKGSKSLSVAPRFNTGNK